MDVVLLLDKQVVAVARSAYHQLRLVCQMHHFLIKKDLVTVIHTLFTSRLDYYNLLCKWDCLWKWCRLFSSCRIMQHAC